MVERPIRSRLRTSGLRTPGRPSKHSDSGVQSIGTSMINVAPGNYFELVARQTFAPTKNVPADKLTGFAIEVVE